MASIVGLDDLSEAIIESGNSLLLTSHLSKEELLTLLNETESLLRNVEQDPLLPMEHALIPSKNALVSADLLRHPDSDVKVSVVSCLTEILRITAPEAPYSDDLMKEIFKLTNEAFEKLADVMSSRSYVKAESVLDNVSKVKSCLVMLDLECHDLILHMFRNFLKIIRSDHPRVVFSSMEMIMITIIDETEDVPADLLGTLLATVKNENQNVSPMAWSLAEKVLSRCGRKLKPYIIEALRSTGTNVDMYSPVVSTICHSVFNTVKVHNTVKTKDIKVVETKIGSQVARQINVNDSKVAEAETDVGVKRKRGWKPNSLMNPEEGYEISWIPGKRDSNKKPLRKRSGGESSLGKLAAKKTLSDKETSPATNRALTGSAKRSRIKMDESDDHDSVSLSSPRLKKLTSCFQDEEPPETKSSKKTRSENGMNKSHRTVKKKSVVEPKTVKRKSLEPKTGKKKSFVEPKTVNSIGKRSSARSDTKRKNLEGASPDTPVPQLSKGKKVVTQAKPLPEESTSKSHPTRSRTAKIEVESDTDEFGEDLVGKRVDIWWPLDKTFYEGVIESYCSRKKIHRVVYTDGESEELNLSTERWKLLDDDLTSSSEDEEIDLPESVPLFDIMQRQKVKKNKNVAVSAEPISSSGVRYSKRALRKKAGKDGSKAENREGKNLKSLKELNAETDRTKEEEVRQDVDHKDEDDNDCSEKQEQSENNGEEEEEEEEEEEKNYAEVESEREDSEEEPKWRETDDVEDEAEEVYHKATGNNLSEIEEDEDES